MTHRFHDQDRRGQTWEWDQVEGHPKVFLVLGPRTPTTHWILDLETGERTYVWEATLNNSSAVWRRVA